ATRTTGGSSSPGPRGARVPRRSTASATPTNPNPRHLPASPGNNLPHKSDVVFRQLSRWAMIGLARSRHALMDAVAGPIPHRRDAMSSIATSTPQRHTVAEPGALLITRGLAGLLNVSVPTLERMKAARQLPRHLILNGGCHRWRRAEVLAWIEADCPPQAE